ncbi:MAG TPA: M56 family metallopeptidase [Nocardioides sp.]|uniref:M56 family metallopeptidase n=1 Tax=Nocardioides sp. TaxID=35761 RepID=UPI002C2EB37E|nr:M56 family metallopeptidase [Nocardioides sp.]HTW13955.1 M56 family metallopeptidase [Nocardioides sp.]
MIAPLVLAGYAVLAATLGARVLTAAPWVRRSPRAGVLAWQALTASVLLASLLSAVALALPFLPLRFPLADLLGSHPPAVVAHYETPLGVWPGIAALAAAAGATTVLVATLVGSLRRVRRTRAEQRDLLRLVGRPHPEGFTVVDHDEPAVYCLPGRERTVVVTSGALALLTARERRLVLGHELRHLRGRHHLALAWSDALARSFGRVRLFAHAHREVVTLVEMTADDAAHGRTDRRTLATALVALGTGSRPEVALGAGDTAAAERVRRLTGPAGGPRWGHTGLVALVGAVALSVPVSVALAPAIEAAARDCCSRVFVARH